MSYKYMILLHSDVNSIIGRQTYYIFGLMRIEVLYQKKCSRFAQIFPFIKYIGISDIYIYNKIDNT